MADYGKMSKAQLLKTYGPFIKSNYGKGEYDFIKGESVDAVRKIITDIDPEPVKKSIGGLASKKYANPVTFVDNLKKKK
tara:strand:- start:274 stop:510 length:237 start_codon:yes stop_codon:yes gene_type:complete